MKLPIYTIPQKLSALEYYSKLFNIHVEYDGNTSFVIYVVRNRDNKLIDMQPASSWEEADSNKEALKTKYIFDYQNQLAA